jgi:DNA-binding transcriptional LysR family regulator
MELRHLKYFIVLAEELHFRRAAERIGIAQPPLSKQIRDLELELEVKLFERNQQRVLLTKAGKVFLKEVRLVMAQVDIAVTRVQQAHQGGAAKISIGFSAPAQQVLEKVLAALKNFTPELEISLQELTGLEQLTAIKCDRIDLGLGYLPEFRLIQAGDLAVKTIQAEKFYLAVSDQYFAQNIDQNINGELAISMDISKNIGEMPPQTNKELITQKKAPSPPIKDIELPLSESQDNLLNRKNDLVESTHLQRSITETASISIDILNKSTFILARDQWGDFAEIRLLEVLKRMNVIPKRIQETCTMETALSLVSQNLGITIINSAFCSFEKRGIIYVELVESILEKDLGMIWRANSSLGYLGELADLIK